MAHPRKAVRAALADRMRTAAPAGWEIEASRDRPVEIDEMPRLLLGVRREVSAPDGNCIPVRRDLSVEMTAHLAVSRASEVEDALDDASVWIEQAIAADPTLGGIVRDTVYRGAELEPVIGGERPAGRITLSFDIRISAPLETF